MAKAYLISIYSEIHDPEKLKAYAADALPALQAHGATPLARGSEIVGKAGNKPLRAVVMEFDSMETAKKAYESEEYKGAWPVCNPHFVYLFSSTRGPGLSVSAHC